MEQDNGIQDELVHVHQCSSCGRFCLPEQFSARDNVRGLYECPYCHAVEALSFQVVSSDVVKDKL